MKKRGKAASGRDWIVKPFKGDAALETLCQVVGK
jgi:hypothetical protein